MKSPTSRKERGAGCDPSRGCTFGSRAADGWSVTEATMRAGEIVVVEPGGELLIAFFGVGVVAEIGPLTQSGLDETFGFAVCGGRGRGGGRWGVLWFSQTGRKGGGRMAEPV